MQSLPIDEILPGVEAALEGARNCVVEAPPGAGKTTRVPPRLLDAGLCGGLEVWVLEPRRLAARLAARYVAEERGERLGGTVGYQVRFDEVAGPATRLRFVTEGVLTRRLLSDPTLARVGAVVFDEFHERHLQADLGVALARRLQAGPRPDIRIVAMSATLDAAPVAAFLGACPVLRSEGRRFEVAVEHAPLPDDRPLAVRVEAAVRRLVDEGLDGDVLVFLPGAAEIRRAAEACSPLAAREELAVVPLHGDLPPAEQDRAVRPASRRKVVLSTNVAETSVTIDGVVAVVDSGLARVAGHSPWSGLPTLGVARISRASATQRAGRAGRMRPGRCLRLYTAQDLAARPPHEAPEVQRLDLAEAALALHGAGIADLSAFDWFEPPAPESLDGAEALLVRLGAVDAEGRVTDLGARMLRMPLHPRLARLVVEADARGVGAAGRLVAALAGERDIRARDGLAAGPLAPRAASPSDLLDLCELFAAAERARFEPGRLRALGLDAGAVRSVDRVRRQLGRASGGRGDPPRGELSGAGEAALLTSILAGYPDRVGRRPAGRGPGARREIMLASGGVAELAPASSVVDAELLVAVDAEERRDAGSGRRGGGTVVRLASAIEPEWLLDLFPEAIHETRELSWSPEGERVEVVSRLLYDRLVLDESRTAAGAGKETSALLAAAALAAGVDALADAEAAARFLARVETVRRHAPELDLPELGDDDLRRALVELCDGRSSLAELREAARRGGLVEALRRRLSGEQSRALARMAPERVSLANGRQVVVRYERDKPAWIASRLQDFFGMREGPRVVSGRAQLVLHLLAPNNRPVQVTTDLAGFWERHYPAVRRELGRRYPRHAWPEKPV